MTKIGIRREDKNIWERRVPIVPEHLKGLVENNDIQFIVQPSDIRIFKEVEYKKSGAKVKEDLSGCQIVFAIKEIPTTFFKKSGVYIFFSHTIKGQKHNMPMLKKLMELKCTLIDYEKVVDEKGRRLIFFGRHAGLAGMVDSLWAFGKRCESEGIKTPFSKIKTAHEYSSLDETKEGIGKVAKEITSSGLPASAAPFICGFSGYGNVAKGAQEIFDLLPIKEIKPQELLELDLKNLSNKLLYKVIFKEADMFEPKDSSDNFILQDYFEHPEKYRSIFEKYVPQLTILMNCIYWSEKYPRLVGKKYLKKLYGGKNGPKLKVIGDISCDVNGAIEATVKCTDPGNPIFVYDVDKDSAIDGWVGTGPVILAVDNLPCEVAGESSKDFSAELVPFVPAIAKADYTVAFEELDLPREIKNAVIVYRGELAPNYKYLKESVK